MWLCPPVRQNAIHNVAGLNRFYLKPPQQQLHYLFHNIRSFKTSISSNMFRLHSVEHIPDQSSAHNIETTLINTFSASRKEMSSPKTIGFDSHLSPESLVKDSAHKAESLGADPAESRTSPPTSPPSLSDASQNILFENPPTCSVITTTAEEQFLRALFDQVKDPLQEQWERLWYNGCANSFKKLAHYFPEHNFSDSTTVKFRGISEPSLEVSNLKREDRILFEKDERRSFSHFAPTSEADRLSRENRARNARNEQERFALLLGLPTYEEYINSLNQRIEVLEVDPTKPSKRQLKRKERIFRDKERRKVAKAQFVDSLQEEDEGYLSAEKSSDNKSVDEDDKKTGPIRKVVMSSENSKTDSRERKSSSPAEHRPLVVGLTKPKTSKQVANMASSETAANLEKEIQQNVSSNVGEAAPSEDNPTAPTSSQPNQKKEKKEKAPKQPKPPKGGSAPPAPTTPALIDLRVGYILRAIAHPNADSLYVSTIAMGDPEGTEHTQVDEETGKIVRTVCSGLNGLVPLEEMQDRKIIVVANLKPVNMRSIKSAAMVLAASPKPEEGADPHAADRVVELVQPPEGSEAGDKVYFEGWPYGEGKGPEKQLNPKKKQWEAIQPGFYTSNDLKVGFDASKCDEVEGEAKGDLVVEGKGMCTVKTLKGAVVR